MRLDIDRYREIIDTLTRNKMRSFLTGFGVFWGVFMLVALLGGGQGLKDLLSSNFDGFANNSAFLVPNATTKPYAGLSKGRQWSLAYKDVERIRQQVPELDIVSPVLSIWGRQAVYGDKKTSCTINGVLGNYSQIEYPDIRYGRDLNEMDVKQQRKVCVLGKKIYKSLFTNGENPCGKKLRMDNIYYDIVGVNFYAGNLSVGSRAEDKVTIPLTVMQRLYNKGDSIDVICMTAKPGVAMSSVMPTIRQVVAKAHRIAPDDQKAIIDLNAELLFGMVDNLFKGVNFLVLLVGIGTLLAGAIGVSNIMMVTVRERTTEIGIRRAIGATPADILRQIVAESIVLTSVAGLSGIVFAVMILEMLELANTTDGIASAHFQISFAAALISLALLSLLGVLAGLIPAVRAMRIRPVEAIVNE